MKTTNKVLISVAALALVTTIGVATYAHAGQGRGQGQSAERQKQVNSIDLATLDQVSMTTEIEEGLLLMREEEKLARDVYLYFADLYGERIFSNIAQAEQQHMDKVGELLEIYGIDDPIGDNTQGVFTSDLLQQLYNDLTAEGSSSLEAALMVGVQVEELDISDLEKLLTELTPGTDIATVYTNLNKGSYNHLRAFIRNLGQQGIDYTSEYISADDLEQRGNGQGKGMGSHEGKQGQGQRGGQGQGKGQGNHGGQR